MKKLVSILLAALLCCAVVMPLAGCGNENFPVTVANITIQKEPRAIVVLDPSAADIISYMSYDAKIVGRSAEVDQSYLAVAPAFGTAASPDVGSIIASGAEVVFANEAIPDDAVEALKQKDIKVIKMSLADSPSALETNYLTIGKILGGAKTGEAKGKESYQKLIEHMERLKIEATSANSTVLNTACYLYSGRGGLRLMTSGTYVDMLIGYTGAVNVAVNIDQNNVDENTLKIANPNYVFYDSEETLNAVKQSAVLSKLTALSANKTLMITNPEISRQGLTALETLEKMVYFMHPELQKNKPADNTATQAATQATQAATQATTQAATTAPQAATTAPQATTAPAQQATTAAATEAKSVAEQYKIDIKDLTLAYEDENDDVQKMQQRLFDLGYIDDKENVTGYYGDVTKAAIEAFQKKSKLDENGDEANAKTLEALFMSNAPKA